MLDDGSGLGRGKTVCRLPAERAEIVAGVTRRHGIVSSQLSTWISTWRTAAKRQMEADHRPAFADLSVMLNAFPTAFDSIEVVVGAVVIRLSKSAAPKQISDIAQRLARA